MHNPEKYYLGKIKEIASQLEDPDILPIHKQIGITLLRKYAEAYDKFINKPVVSFEYYESKMNDQNFDDK